MVESDGFPYTLASRIMGWSQANILMFTSGEESFTYGDCDMESMGEPDFKDHVETYDHAFNIETDKRRKYNDIVMLPGTLFVALFYQIKIC